MNIGLPATSLTRSAQPNPALFIIKEPQVIVHEADQPDLVFDFTDTHQLAGEHLAEIDLTLGEAVAWVRMTCFYSILILNLSVPYLEHFSVTDLKAIIFDVDGTMADTERDGHRLAFNSAFTEAGLDWHWDIETYGRLLEVTGGKERIRHFVEQPGPGFDAPADIESFIRKLHESKTRHYLLLLMSGAIPLRPGVERLIHEARTASLKLAIATTTTPDNVTALLKANLGEDSLTWFDVIAAGDIVPRKKPAPDVYRYALQRLGLKAAQCLAIEDSEHGLSAATGAGIKTIITVNGYTQLQDFTGAAIVLDHLGEPDASFKVLAGDVREGTLVDLPLLHSVSGESICKFR